MADRLHRMLDKLTLKEIELGKRKMELHEDTLRLLVSMLDAFTFHVDQQEKIGIDPEVETELDLDTEEGQQLMMKSMMLWAPFLSWLGTEWTPAVLKTLDDTEKLDDDLEENIKHEAMKEGISIPKKPTMN